MGLFKRRPPAPVTGHAGDDATLAELVRLKVDLTQPRRWEHFLYCADADGERFLVARARHAGWDVAALASGDHGIVASRADLPVDASTVPEARTFFESLAAHVAGGEYDGWGTEAD
jgi:hypothetical protein